MRVRMLCVCLYLSMCARVYASVRVGLYVSGEPGVDMRVMYVRVPCMHVYIPIHSHHIVPCTAFELRVYGDGTREDYTEYRSYRYCGGCAGRSKLRHTIRAVYSTGTVCVHAMAACIP
jgi:hypothetical protein